MAKRRRRTRARVVKPKEEEILEEELLEEDEDFEDEEEEPTPKSTTRRRRRKVVEEPPDDEEDEEEEEPAPKKVTRRRTRKVVKPEPEEPEPVKADVSDLDVFYGLLESLDEGQTLVISRTGEDTWSVSSASGGVAAGGGLQKLKGKAYYDEVYSSEFVEHHEMWKELTFAEKKAQARKIKAKWEAHEDSRVEVMRVTAAVRAELKIEKYKPEYRTRAARAAIKG